MAIGLVRIFDRIVAPYAGLVHIPNTSVRYATTEFDFVATINELGFRGESIDDARPEAFRIAALGDSFTYGWGVALESTWPFILENLLQRRGIPAQVLNLGAPGKGPEDYAEIANRSLARLRPDLVLVAVLQGDDLQQVQERLSFRRPRALLNRTLPNLTRLLQPARFIKRDGVQREWILQAELSLRAMSQNQMRRFRSLDAELQRLFTEGLLNPFLVSLAIQQPRYFLDTLDDSGDLSQQAVSKLAAQLARIAPAAASEACAVLVLSVPYGLYVDQRYLDNHRRLGFETTPRMLTSTAPDRSIAAAAQQAGLSFHSVLADFRRTSELLYYDLDQHFTPAGNRVFAELLLPRLEDEYSRCERFTAADRAVPLRSPRSGTADSRGDDPYEAPADALETGLQ